MMSAPRLQIQAVNLLDDLWLRERQHVAVALEVLRVVLEPRAAKVGFGEAFGLKHRAHGPVDDDDALLQERAQGPFAAHGVRHIRPV